MWTESCRTRWQSHHESRLFRHSRFRIIASCDEFVLNRFGKRTRQPVDRPLYFTGDGYAVGRRARNRTCNGKSGSRDRDAMEVPLRWQFNLGRLSYRGTEVAQRTEDNLVCQSTISCASQKDETRCILWGSNMKPIPDGDIAEAKFRLRVASEIPKAVITLGHSEAVSSQGQSLVVVPALSTATIVNPRALARSFEFVC